MLFWSWEPPCQLAGSVSPRRRSTSSYPPTRSDQLWQAARATAQPDFPHVRRSAGFARRSPGSSSWRQRDRLAAPMAWLHRHHRGEDTTPLGGQPAAELLPAAGPRAPRHCPPPARRLSSRRPHRPLVASTGRLPRQPLPDQSPHRACGRTRTTLAGGITLNDGNGHERTRAKPPLWTTCPSSAPCPTGRISG